MKGREQRLGELSKLKFAFYTCPLPSNPKRTCLLVQFAGTYREGAEGHRDALFMAAMVKAALVPWAGWGLILDLRRLRFPGGDAIIDALTAGNDEWDDAPYPTRVVVSDQCAAGLQGLLEDKIAEDPDDWLFDTIDKAMASIEAHHQQHRGHVRDQLG